MSAIDRWPVISPWLDRLLDADGPGCEALLARLRHDDPALADELEALLAQQTGVDRARFLESQPWTGDATLRGRVVGNYTLEESIGQGGMGNVWLARRSDGRFEGRAAVKFLNVSMIGRGGVERFEQEGRILGRLAHRHIARLLDAGVDGGGQPYLVLEYVEGTTIDAWCDAHGLDVDARLGLFVDVLAAVAHAHVNLILHRDLKPSNILVGADGQVKLLDFGIAKLLDDPQAGGDEAAVTLLAGRAFTPDYAAPEQVQGGPVTTATDVYALGVLLYVLLSGRHPTADAATTQVDRLRGIVEREPMRLSDAAAKTDARDRARTLRGDLDHIVAKALRKDPAERYSGAAAFADDLHRYREQEPVTATADSWRYRAGKFVRRNRVAVGASAAIGFVLVAGIAATLWQACEAGQERDRAIAQLDRAEAISEFLKFLLDEASPSGRPFTTEQLVDRGEQLVQRAFSKQPELRAELLMMLGQQNIALMRTTHAASLLRQAWETVQPLADPSVKARTGCAWARELANAGRFDEADALIQQSLAQLPDRPIETGARMQCLGYAVQIANFRNDSAKAIAYGLAQSRLASQLPTASPLLRGDAFATLADALRSAGRNAEADGYYRTSVALLESMGAEQSMSMVVQLNNWAISLWVVGRPRESEALFARAIAIAGGLRTTGDLPAYLYNSYGHVLMSLERAPEAADIYAKAIEAARRSGDEVTLLKGHRGLSAADVALGRLDDAEREQAIAESQMKKLLPPTHPAWALEDDSRSRLALARGDLAEALARADRSIAAESRVHSLAADHASTLLQRAAVELALHRPEDARTDALQAIDVAGHLQPEQAMSFRVGSAYVTLAHALVALDRPAEATDAARLAVKHIVATADPEQPLARDAQALLTR